MDASQALWLVTAPALMALVAIGAVLCIKIIRRRQATTDPRHTGTVPAKPLSAPDARRMIRRYLLVSGLVLALLAAAALAR